ncbi:MAG: LysE family translocator [Halioglobus sp.]|nr:LysE family translocator [Halioglobus sp.]
MDLSQWLALLSICLLGAMSPGPSLAVVFSCAFSGGQRAGYHAALAHGLGVGLYGLLTVAGLALLLTRDSTLYTALQVAGALYLLYLGARALRPHSPASEAVADDTTGGIDSPVVQGFLVAFLNPKLAVFMLDLFSQFLQPEFGLRDKGLMVVTVGITDAAWYSLVVLLVSRPGFRSWLARSARAVDTAFGLILVALALTVLHGALAN